MDSPITRLKDAGLDYASQAALVGVNPVSLRRWEDSNNLPPFQKVLLSMFADAVEAEPDLAEEVAHLVLTRGFPQALHRILGAALSTVDSE